MEVWGNISHKKIIKIVGSGELYSIIMCSGTLFRHSLFHGKNEIEAKINASFRFPSFRPRKVNTSTVYDIDW